MSNVTPTVTVSPARKLPVGTFCMSVRVANTTWPASWRSVKPNTGSSSAARNRTSITTRARAPCANADTRSPPASSNQAAVISASD